MWTKRFVNQLMELSRTMGWAFCHQDDTRAGITDYMPDIYEKLEKIQVDTNLINPASEVR